MEHGASIDPVSLRPKQAHDAEKRQVREAQKEKSLRQQAEDMNLVHSPEGQRYIEMLSTQLIKRVEELIKEDPAANMIQQLLDELGHKYSLAKRAVEELQKRQFR